MEYRYKFSGLLMRIGLKKVVDQLPEFEILNYKNVSITGVSYDTRTIEQGDIYFPIKGENFDGHDFIPQAFHGGAVATLCDSKHVGQYADLNNPIIVVDSIEEGLEKVVNVLFSNILVPRVAITGSTGKTSTREMLTTILKSKGGVLSSDSNINTLWGNAKLLSKYDKEKYIVLELAMDRPREIGWQCRALEPDLGAILNIGYVHAANVGGIENVYKTKKDLADYLQRSGKPLVLNADDEWLQKLIKDFSGELVTYGKAGQDFMLIDSSVSIDGTEFFFRHQGQQYKVRIEAYGKELAYNALCAVALASKLGIEVEESVNAIKNYKSPAQRFEIHNYKKGVTVVNDAYNANPTSMKMAIETFDKIFDRDRYQRIVILGDMKELGEITARKHNELGELVDSKNFDKVYYVGDYYRDFKVGQRLTNWQQAKQFIENLNTEEKEIAVLLKASHSIGLYNIC
jgi:UDP-N-acetylmuramoyl-tripeptide--D-alanyl-D-alanine ligase